MNAAERILVCLRWGIGDLVMELPALDALRRQAPRAHITALGAAPAVELLEGEAAVDDVVEVQAFGLEHWGDPGTAEARRGLADWARRAGFDCVMDGSHAPRGARMALESLGLPWLDTGGYLGSCDREGSGLTLLAQAVRAVWGVDVAPDRPPRLTVGAREQAAATTLTRGLAGDAPLVGLAVSASSPLKRGHAAEFARAADVLVERSGGHALLFAGKDEQDSRTALAAMTRQRQGHLIEPMHLRQTAAVLARCSVLVCNDTGLMHVAAAVGVPVVGIFACTSPSLYLPPGGVAVQRWTDPCRYPEAPAGRFGVTPCAAANSCLCRAHRRTERWAGQAVASALAQLGSL